MANTLKRDARWYQAIRTIAGPILCRLFHFRTNKYTLPEGPSLVVSNHNADFDPIFLGYAFKNHMYFVASEHVFRWGFLSKLLIAVFHPIARLKGSTDSSAALAIIRKLRGGTNVCLFAEGDRSFNGVTGPTFPATGKLVKTAKASLVTYRIKGGYLATPRWGKKRRHGPVEGEIVHIYSAEEIAAMSPDEINEAIRRDLHEDAFERQEAEHKKYRGKNLAENLELALYICPMCGKIGKLHSSGNRFYCECGLSVTYTEEGCFEGNTPFANVRDWDQWQQFEIKRRTNFAKEALFSDDNISLLRVTSDHGMEPVGKGTLSISRKELACGEFSIPLAEIQNMALCGKSHIVFTTVEGIHYELRAETVFCGRKYIMFFQKAKD
ncbi:MAG: 1-acyl-sn-glycerol-3-phosphate acyltransferase [Clostridia bacterium]|nr:1-acyl-sn-glycerol-3-phosphate acyltransferase [Clostridia bacterium]MBR0025601.1 1-acyl-sn-glycerol-3-phosphate acyltransferase [Clostridia bacterium]